MSSIRLVMSLGLAAVSGIGQVLPEPPVTTTNMAVDPLGRETPRGAVLGFIRSAQKGKYGAAARYLELSQADMAKSGPRLAQELQAILDQGFPASFESISNKPEGSLDDGIPGDHERAGVITLPEGHYDLLLRRVNDRTYKLIWLVSAETVRSIPEMYSQTGSPWIEDHLPEAIKDQQLFGVAVWQWIAPLITIPLTATVLYGIWVAVYFLLGLKNPARKRDPWWVVPIGPFYGLMVSVLAMVMFRRVGIPALHRYYYWRVFGVIAWICIGWLIAKGIDRLIDISQARVVARVGLSATSMFVLGRRVLKVFLTTLILLAILTFLGFNVSTALAGLGIGGIAIALAAQKTLENLIGGVTLLSDEAIRVGDTCKLGDRAGTVEDVSLRSTRIRTEEGTVLTVPNGSLATMQIENLSGRTRFLFRTTLGLRHETTAEQLKTILESIRALIGQHPNVERNSYRVRLIGFGPSSLDIEIFSQILAPSMDDFARFREEILFSIMGIIEAAGSSLAFPSQTLYISRDTPNPLDGGKTKNAAPAV